MKTMKTIALIIAMAISSAIYSQSPQAFTYQSVIDSSGNVLSNRNVSLRMSILQGSLTGPSVYTEDHSATTNANGFVSINVGQGTVVSGSFSTISWGTNSYYLKVEVDPQGGSSFIPMGATQLLSVPYALYSQSSAPTAATGFMATTGNQSPPINTTVVFNSVTFNDGLAYNSTTGKFTAPSTGIYMLTLDLNTGGADLSIRVNSTAYYTITNTFSRYCITIPVKLNFGDVVDIYSTSSGNSINAGSFFSIVKQ